jgi:hypothetical protein
MMRGKTQSGQVLIIILGTLLFGGSAAVVGTLGTGESIHELKSKFGHAVKDPKRARAVNDLLERWEKEGKAYDEATARSHAAIIKLAHRHDATRADFQAVNSEVDARDARAVDRFVDTRASIKQQVTSQEWQTVFGGAR